MRLIIVEDEALVAMMLEDMLADLGCVVVGAAADVSHGLALVEENQLDAAVLDVNLGGEKVYPVAERLRARRVPFIFSTGYGLRGIATQFARIPTLAKPYGPPALEAMLCLALAAAGS